MLRLKFDIARAEAQVEKNRRLYRPIRMGLLPAGAALRLVLFMEAWLMLHREDVTVLGSVALIYKLGIRPGARPEKKCTIHTHYQGGTFTAIYNNWRQARNGVSSTTPDGRKEGKKEERRTLTTNGRNEMQRNPTLPSHGNPAVQIEPKRHNQLKTHHFRNPHRRASNTQMRHHQSLYLKTRIPRPQSLEVSLFSPGAW